MIKRKKKKKERNTRIGKSNKLLKWKSVVGVSGREAEETETETETETERERRRDGRIEKREMERELLWSGLKRVRTDRRTAADNGPSPSVGRHTTSDGALYAALASLFNGKSTLLLLLLLYGIYLYNSLCGFIGACPIDQCSCHHKKAIDSH